MEFLGVAAAGIMTLACGPKAPTVLPTHVTSLPHSDAPYELADNADLEVVRDKYSATRVGSPERRRLRNELSREYARRIDKALSQGNRRAGFLALTDLAELWTAQEIIAEGAEAELAPYKEQVLAIRKTFARSGGDAEVVLALIIASVQDPANEAEYQQELDEVLRFGDELSTAQYGDGAVRARPIEVLRQAVQTFPAPMATDRLVTLLIARQQALDTRFRQVGADLSTIRAHGRSVLRAAWDVASTMTRANRVEDTAEAVSQINGLGDDPALRAAVAGALRKNAKVDAWVQLADSFRSREGDAADLIAGRQVCEEAVERFPTDARGHLCAGHFAYEAGQTRLAIRHFEAGLRIDPTKERAAQRLSSLYQLVVARLGLSDRAEEARKWLSRLEAFHRARRKRGQAPLEPGLPEAYAAIARGLVSLGDLESARAFLTRSLEIRPSTTAHELLGTIALRRDRHDEAVRHLEAALALPVSRVEQAFDRNRVLRLLGEAQKSRGDQDKATEAFRQAIVEWTELRGRAQLARGGLAEAEVERGKVLWHLGEREKAIEAFHRAIDADPDGASTYTEAVAFLIVRGEYEDALDAYHRALGSAQIRDYFKVYMSLWMLAESRRQQITPDPLVAEFLGGRTGSLWYDHLAQYAVGRGSRDRLEQRANTRGRQAELYYYSAVLADEGSPIERQRLLRRVLGTDTVLFFEYDMAKRQLSAPLRDAPAARR